MPFSSVPRSVPARLLEAGVTIIAGDAADITYKVGDRHITADLAIFDHLSSAAPVLQRIHRRPARRILVACQSIAEPARRALLAAPLVDLSVTGTGELVLSGTTYRPPDSVKPGATDTDTHRRRRAAERVCVLTREPLRQYDIAAAIGVTQQAVSKMAAKHPLPKTPMSAAERRDILAALASVRPDTGLIETYWYGIDPAVDQARAAIALGRELTVPVLASGEVAADVLAPWRVPTSALLYATELIDLADLGLVASATAEATLTLRVPADTTISLTAKWWHDTTEVADTGLPTVDPVVVLEDLTAGGEVDDGAVTKLTDWITQR